MIKKSFRQLYRIFNRFKHEGISGLIHRFKRPKASLNKKPDEDEKVISIERLSK